MKAPALLVLGLGNILCGDDGLGVRVVQALGHEYEVPPGVRLLDGGTLGLSLLGQFEAEQDVIVVDAIRGEGPAGTLVRLDGDQVPPAVRERLSPHQVGVADLLDGLRLLDLYPRNLVLLGLVPETLDLGLEPSPRVEEGLDGLIAAVVEEAARMGHRLVRRESSRGAA